MHLNIDSSWISFLRGPADDLIKVETCRPDNIFILLYKEQRLVLLTDTFLFISVFNLFTFYSSLNVSHPPSIN